MSVSEFYANHVRLESTIWDFRLLIGVLVNPQTGEGDVRAQIRMAPSVAKALSEILANQIRQYEQTFGLIPALPPGPPSQPTTGAVM